MEKEFDVLVVGYAGYDLAVAPVPNNIMSVDTGTAPEKVITVGGDGINASTSFVHLGCRTALTAAVGQDMFADTVLGHLKKHGIDDRYIVKMKDFPTYFTLLLVGEDGEHHGLIRRGCIAEWTRDMIPDEALQKSRHLHYASFFPMKKLDPDAPQLLRRAKELGLTTSMDAVTYRGDGDPLAILSTVLPYIDVFLPSYDDAKQFFGTGDIQEMKKIMAPFGGKFFGVKCGGDGLFLTDFKQDVMVPPMCRGKVVDTTGAGDSCAAGVVTAFLKGGDLAACAAIGSANAAFIVQQFGATTGCTDYDSVANLAREFGYDVP